VVLLQKLVALPWRMNPLADSTLVGLSTLETSAIQGGISHPILGWIIFRKDLYKLVIQTNAA